MGRTTGRIGRYNCPNCGPIEQFHWDDGSPVVCECGAEASRAAQQVKQFGTDYEQPILSDAMGCHASQVEQHRRLHPSVPITNDGRVIVASHQEGKRIRKALGFYDKNGYTR